MRALVLGGTGFVGSALLDHLLAAGDEVVVGARRPPAWLTELPLAVRAFDLLEPSLPPDLFEGVEVVYHLAWAIGPGAAPPAPAPSPDVLGTRRLAAAVPAGTRLVFVSSGGSVYGPLREAAAEDHPLAPIDAYGVAKRDAERVLTEPPGLDHVILRVGNAYGPCRAEVSPRGVVAAFLASARRGAPLKLWGAGDPVRDYVHLDDVTRALRLAAQAPAAHLPAHRTLNIGSGRGVALRELVTLVSQALGAPLAVSPRPGRPAGIARNVLDSTAAAAALGWRAEVPLEDGLRRLARPGPRVPVSRCG